MEKSCIVSVSRFAEKQLKRLPAHVKGSLQVWAKAVEAKGIAQVRKIRGYHDEPLRGNREGQRSVRLNRSYRVIYEESSTSNLTVIGIQEITKHVY